MKEDYQLSSKPAGDTKKQIESLELEIRQTKHLLEEMEKGRESRGTSANIKNRDTQRYGPFRREPLSEENGRRELQAAKGLGRNFTLLPGEKLKDDIGRMVAVQNQQEEESQFIKGEATRLEEVIKALQIPKESLIDEFKKAELDLKKCCLVLEAKTRSDKAILKLRIDRIEQLEKKNSSFQRQTTEFDQINSQMVATMIKTLEEIKEQQNQRMNLMMRLLEDRVQYQANVSPIRYGMRTVMSNPNKPVPPVRSLKRRSTLAEMLPNYDPEVQRLLEQTLRGKSSDGGAKYSKDKDTQGPQFESTSGTKEWGGSTPRTDGVLSRDV